MNGLLKRRQALGICAVCFLMTAIAAQANNIELSGVNVLALDAYPQSETNAWIEFNIAWDNSWRFDAVNHDAAWVFFKAQTEADGPWRHVKLIGEGLNPPHYVTGSGTEMEIAVPGDGIGLFIRRAQQGSGNVAASGVRAVWDFSALGLENTNNVTIQAFGVEMVLVPEGSFWLGSGGPVADEKGTFVDGAWKGSGATTSFPFHVTSEAAITIGPNPGQLWGTVEGAADFASIGPEGTLSAAFPKGYVAFYCLKYPVTQGQFRDFLNSLTRTQQTAASQQVDFYWANNVYLYGGATTPAKRSGIRNPAVLPAAGVPIVFGCDLNNNGVFDEEDDGQDLAMHPLSPAWANRITFWMGLRPMTELEWEKAARGPDAPVAGAYVWGTTNAPNNVATLSNSGKGTEAADSEARNAHINNNAAVSGPVRVGIFATANTSREGAGASYWGIMDMAGNVQDQVIMVGDDHALQNYSRPFTGVHGTGDLPASGVDNVANWPYTNNGYGAGRGWRGGYYRHSDGGTARISDRTMASRRDTRGLEGNGSWRAVRTVTWTED